MLKLTEILEIIKTIDQSSIQHFEFEQQETKLMIIKNGATVEAVPLRSSTQKIQEQSTEVKYEPIESKGENLHQIVAPMIGTFYAAAEPGAEPFVKIGQKITDDTIVCVLEAMKLFNEIEAGATGEIVELLAKDGEFVEYGQPLFLLRIS